MACMTNPSRPGSPPAVQRRRWVPLLLFTLLGVAQLHGAWRGWENLGAKDWNPLAGQLLAEVTTLQRFGQFPLWNPWRTGGQVAFAQPESLFLSPALPLALVLGVMPALKLLLLPVFVAGCLGMHRLARELSLSGAAALVPPLAFFGCSIFPLYVAGGLPNWVFGLALLPWFLWSLLRACADHRWIPLAALLWAGFLFCGDIFHYAFMPVLAGVWVTGLALQRRSVRPLLVLLAVLLVGACLASVKLAPLLEVYAEYPRRMAAQDRYLSPALVARALLDPRLPDLGSIGTSFVRDGALAAYWIDTGAFLGPVVLLLALGGAVARWRRAAVVLACGVVAGWLALGAGVTPSLWNAVHVLPVLSSMQAPERLILYLAFALALLAGLGAEALLERLRARAAAARLAPAVLLALVAVPLVVVHRDVAAAAFTVTPSKQLPPPGDFRQSALPQRAECWGVEQYENVLCNLGNALGTADIPTPLATRPDSSPGYRGEVYLRHRRGELRDLRVTPNVITLRAELAAPDRLMVNQNWFPGWVARGTASGPLEEHENLLSLPLPAGTHELTLRFVQPGLRAGVLLTLLAVLLVLAWLLADRQRRRRGPRAAAAPLARHDAVALLGCVALVAALGGPRTPQGGEAMRWRTPEPRTGRVLTVAAGAELQAAIDAAQPGDVLLLPPGEHDGFRLGRGLTVAAATPGSVTLRTPCHVSGVPRDERATLIGLACAPAAGPALTLEDCDGLVYLQSVVLGRPDGSGDGAPPVLVTEWCERVSLFDVTLHGAARVSHTSLVAADSRLAAGGRPGPGLDAAHSLLLLNETSVRGGAGAGPGLRLRRSRLVSSSSPGTMVGVAAGPDGQLPDAPALVLVERSLALVSETTLAGAAARCDSDSRVQPCVPPLPRLRLTARPGQREVDIEAWAPPGSRGFLLLGSATTLQPVTDEVNHLQVLLAVRNIVQPVAFDDSGTLLTRARLPADLLAPGQGWFAQIAIEPPEAVHDRRDQRFSLLSGGLYVPGDG
jgi:hypothetical protein